jgi:N5-(cytidine 5'-diphosphoramidyl)-L-glutamine hydrolase
MKKIAITQRVIFNREYFEIRDALDVSWAKLFSRLGYLPVILPSLSDFEKYFSEMKIDGLILSGGNDLSSLAMSEVNLLRDNFEKRVLEFCLGRGLPVLGVCRGMQFIQSYFGGALEVHEEHVKGAHGLQAEKNSSCFSILSAVKTVNSHHRYCVKNVPPGFSALARSEDGLVEAMENPEKKIRTVMWHPERNEPLVNADVELLKQFFE